MALERTTMSSRILKALYSNVLGQLILVAYRLVLPPLFLRAWGADLYGSWLLVASIGIYLSLSDGGVRHYLVNLFAQSPGGEDTIAREKYGTLVRTGVLVSLILPLVAMLGLGLILALCRAFGWGGISALGGEGTGNVAFLLSLYQAVLVPQAVLCGIYRARGLFHLGVMISNLTQLFQLALVSWALLKGRDPAWVALLQVLPAGLAFMLSWLDLNRRFRDLHVFRLFDVDLSLIRSWIRPSAHFLMIQFSGILSVQGVITVAGLVTRPAEIALFATLRSLCNVISQLLGVVTTAVSPDLTDLDHRGDRQGLRRLVLLSLRAAMTCGGLSLLVLSLFGERIHGLWLGSRVPFDGLVMALLLSHVVQAAVWGVSKCLLMSVNRHEALSRLVLVNAVVSLLACAWGGARLGPAGLAGGLLVSELLLSFWIAPWLVSRVYRELPFGLLLVEALPVALTVLAVFFAPALAWLGAVVLTGLFLRSLSASGLLGEGRRASIPR